MKNRMRELRSCGTVRDKGSDALVYSEAFSTERNREIIINNGLEIGFCGYTARHPPLPATIDI